MQSQGQHEGLKLSQERSKKLWKRPCRLLGLCWQPVCLDVTFACLCLGLLVRLGQARSMVPCVVVGSCGRLLQSYLPAPFRPPPSPWSTNTSVTLTEDASTASRKWKWGPFEWMEWMSRTAQFRPLILLVQHHKCHVNRGSESMDQLNRSSDSLTCLSHYHWSTTTTGGT